jgi:hypothetical protein
MLYLADRPRLVRDDEPTLMEIPWHARVCYEEPQQIAEEEVVDKQSLWQTITETPEDNLNNVCKYIVISFITVILCTAVLTSC